MNGFAVRCTALLVAGCAALIAPAAMAETFPARPIRLIVPFAPGGSNDIVGRAVAVELSERFKQQVIVDNKPGAGGVIGAELVARAAPDGYTLLLISSSFTMNNTILKLPFDPDRAFEPVALLGAGPSVLAVPVSLPVKTVGELVTYARDNPGKLNIASTGVGSFQHFAAELFKLRTKTDMAVVQYKGGNPALADLAAGHVQVGIGSLIQVVPFLQSGKIRILGIAGKTRSPLLPDVPTVSEAGVPGFEAVNWWGILAPAGTPPAVVERLDSEIRAVLTNPAVIKKFTDEGAEASKLDRAAFTDYLKSETRNWAAVAKEAKIKAE